MVLTEKIKKYLALGLAVSVMSLGLLSASTSSVSASTPTPTTVTSQDGREITVTAGGTAKLHISKKDNFNANIDFTNSKGKNQNIKVTVTPLPDQKYQIETQEQGERHVVISGANPLDDKQLMGLNTKSQNVSSPDVIISMLFTGTASYQTLVTAFGTTMANRIISNWALLETTLAQGGPVAVLFVLLDWQIIGAAIIIGALA